MQMSWKRAKKKTSKNVESSSHVSSRKISCSNILLSNIILNGCSISEEQRIINELNFFFSKVRENLSKNFDHNDSNNFKKFLSNKIDSSIFMEPPRVNEVFNHNNSLSLRKSVGHNNIPPYFLKDDSNIIAPVLCYFF